MSSIFKRPKPLIGVIHLAPLPGVPDSPGLEAVTRQATEDLDAYSSGGLDGVLVENENDRPYSVTARPETIAAMTRILLELGRQSQGMPLGCEILLNDPKASLASASAGGGSFIRTDYFVDRMSRPEYGGMMAIDPAGLIAYRARLEAHDLAICADIQVKHAVPLEKRSLTDSAREATAKGADAIVVTGALTGEAPAVEDIERAKRGAARTPVLVGSGLTADNAYELLSHADGAIVGSSLMEGGRVVESRVRALVERVENDDELSEPGECHGG